MGFMDKMKDLVGITDEYEDDYDITQDEDDYDITQEEIDAYKNELNKAAAAAAPEPPVNTGISPLAFNEVAPPQKFTDKQPAQVDKASRNDSGAFKMVVIEPKSIEECRKLIDNLRNNKPVIIPQADRQSQKQQAGHHQSRKGRDRSGPQDVRLPERRDIRAPGQHPENQPEHLPFCPS